MPGKTSSPSWKTLSPPHEIGARNTGSRDSSEDRGTSPFSSLRISDPGWRDDVPPVFPILQPLETRSQLPSLLEFLAGAPLLELEFKVQHGSRVAELGEDIPPVNLRRLQRIVFPGTRPKLLRPLTSHIIHPHHTKVILTCYLPDNHNYLES